MLTQKLVIATVFYMGSFAYGLALAETPPTVRLNPSFASAKAIVHLYRQGSVDKAQMDRLLAMEGVQAMLKQVQRFRDDATVDKFRSGLRMSVAGKEVPHPDHFQLNRTRKNMAGIEKTMTWIENHPDEISARVLRLISPYSPVSEPLEVKFFIVVGGTSDGWASNGVFYLALQYFGDDVEGMLILLSHELYHVVQDKFMGPLLHKEDTQQSRVEQLLRQTIREGTASYVCDPLNIKDGGAYTEWYSKKYVRNLNHLKLSFDLFETLVFRAYHDPDVPLRNLYSIGFSGALESPVYFVGFAMAREIERISGRETLLDLMQQSSAEFFAHYAAIAGRADGEAIPFSAGFQDILKAVQERPLNNW
jgi:hypothetical protein